MRRGVKTNISVTDMLNVVRAWLGYNEKDKTFLEILNVYNNHKPLARGYTIRPSDEWCDAFISACAIKAGCVDLIGTEVGVERHVDIFKGKGIWIEDGAIEPKPGDIIVYNWLDNTQPNDGKSSHIGIVEDVSNGKIVAIEGNKGEVVARRIIPVGWGYIRGFARPNYAVRESRRRITGEEINDILSSHLATLSCSAEAETACRNAITSGIFKDGDTDGLLDNPKGYLTREQLAMVLDRLGLLDDFI